MTEDTKEKETQLLVGIDVGSTTTKIAVIDGIKKEILYSDYKRHYAAQLQSVCNMLEELNERFPGCRISLALTGSGAKPIAEALGVPYMQEVVANAIALQKGKQPVRTAIELGGQDAKIIFFGGEDAKGGLQIKDMRMNGSCAGGTGAFLDEIASVLKVPVEELNGLAEQGTCVYDISGRCGVYAKTDIQPLLNQGASKEDIALSAFHAIAKQTIGGLAQGLDIQAPVAFEGGPLTFNPVLIRVFAERLQLQEKDIVIPEYPVLMVACGAAYSLQIHPENEKEPLEPESMISILKEKSRQLAKDREKQGLVFFASDEEAEAFHNRHKRSVPAVSASRKAGTKKVYLGIDAGSTTTKVVLLDENEEIVESFYASNGGMPLDVAKNALLDMYRKYRKLGVELDILAAGVTGYGEMLFHKAFRTEYHMVETVAHAKAAGKYVKDATFILDIGGQDMKAIWLDHGVITNIVVNEACSSGCGSFLENFAASLDIPVEKIAEMAFSSTNPAVLGSRCTVFMNSSIITEQRNGKKAEDIMAGLCRSVIENVFTKVIRISNLDSLGERIVVQGGTFENDAVLCALEQYVGREVVRSPYPGLMGAIGAALLTKERFLEEKKEKTFIGAEGLDAFAYEQKTNMVCPFCANHCKRMVVSFSNGDSWVTNNRCERGEITGDPKNAGVKEELKRKKKRAEEIPDLFRIREELLFKEYAFPVIEEKKNITIGIPRVLSYWETMPFWTVFCKSLGYDVMISHESTRKIYESGLAAVTSDTICFPAKLVHGHMRDLAERGVDRIFMPSITAVETENREKTSESMCAIVKGYPIVLRNSDNPGRIWGIPFDAPLFHWHSKEDRSCQMKKYMEKTFGIDGDHTERALKAADEAQEQFHRELKLAGAAVIEKVKKDGTFAVVLAARPYQNDALVNHGLPQMFTKLGIPVLTVDSIPGLENVDLKNSRLDIVNNYHARMLSGAVMAAEKEYLEYVQVVSFGCGHDAYLSDEIIRMMKEISGKVPLILKVDESDAAGSLSIRVRSFVETIAMRRKSEKPREIHTLQDAYPVKFTKECVGEKVVLVPNTSHAFSRIMSAAMHSQHIRAVPLEIGREKAISLGKKYVHNDICFPAQIVIGEILAELESGKYNDKEVAVAMGKYVGDCRLTHYTALLRKALDDAGYFDVPILTNDDKDIHNIHPGFKMNLKSSIGIATALPMIDILEELLRKIRPYETVPGSTEKAFAKAMDEVVGGLQRRWVSGAKKGFRKAIEIMKKVSYNRLKPHPTVLIVGEYLLNFHPGANHDIEKYLEDNGFEIIEARMTDVIRKTYFYQDAQVKEYHVKKPLLDRLWLRVTNMVFNLAHNLADSVAKEHPLYTPACRMDELVKDSDPIIHHTFDAGEGVLIPGEIIHHAKHGCKAVVILQPFGCLPNHVVGRGIIKKMRELYPDVQILPLDYDPDVSFANVENRLQMLIMNHSAAM